MGSGNCLNVYPPGMGMAHGILFWHLHGKRWQAGFGRVNYAPHESQCYVHFPFTYLAGQTVRFRDLMSTAV